MRRVLLIVNPAAARTRRRLTRAVVRILEREGCQVTVIKTNAPGDAERAAREHADAVDVVAVYGGDGTIMQAVAGIQGRDVPVGLLPGGTGNLLAGNLRLPRRVVRAARVVAHGTPRIIDLGRIEQASGVQFFAVACGSGFDAQLMAETTGRAKRRWGFLAYVARAIALAGDVRPHPYRITVDGVAEDVAAASILIANCREFAPPLVAMGPDIALDDGWLDAVVLDARGPIGALRAMWRLVRGRVGDPRVRRMRGRTIVVESDPPRPVQLDGEVGGTTPFTATIIPGGLSVLVPPRSD